MKVTELKNQGLNKSYKIVIPSDTINKAIENYSGKEFSQFKKDLADLSVDKILPPPEFT